jgi:hypothetical protein
LEASNSFDFWKDPAVGRSADIMAAPDKVGELNDFLETAGISYKLVIQDVQR